MDAKITGSTLPVLEVALNPGDKLVAETGQLSWMTAGIELNTTHATAGAGGFLGAIGRALSGGGLFMTEYTAPYQPGLVAFAAKIPGQMVEVQVQPGRGYLIHKHGFVCASEGVQLATGFQQSLGAGIFGGNGFLMQRLSGACRAWVELGGEVVTYDLAPGEVLRAHPGHVGMFEESVGFNITTIRGIQNMIFGGDGLFLAELRGPGKVWLQTLTLPNLAHALTPYLKGEAVTAPQSIETAAELGVAGAVLKSFFNR
ncbi:MAG TPA: TIGR00266 family protein [Acetobacteraceae bacterium]|nr:TIGR00266 family protein [Acetobacteraceae bacterium]